MSSKSVNHILTVNTIVANTPVTVNTAPLAAETTDNATATANIPVTVNTAPLAAATTENATATTTTVLLQPAEVCSKGIINIFVC